MVLSLESGDGNTLDTGYPVEIDIQMFISLRNEYILS